MRIILYLHLAATIASVFVARSEEILTDPAIRTLIALPLFATMIICPIAMLISVLKASGTTPWKRAFAIGSDLALSATQLLAWLPTIQ